MLVKTNIIHPFQHDRFYRQGEIVDMPKIVFDDLQPKGLVEEAKGQASDDVEARPARKAK